MNEIMMLKKLLLPFCFLLFNGYFTHSQPGSAVPGYKLLNPQKTETKNFYLLSLLENISEYREYFSEDQVLKQISARIHERLTGSLEDPASFPEKIKFTEEEIAEAGNRMEKLFEEEEILKQLYTQHLVPSGCYNLLVNNSSGGAIFKAMWEQDAKAVNKIIDIFGTGMKPPYPRIDSISYLAGSKKHQTILNLSANLLSDLSINSTLFFRIPFEAALLFLDVNDRDEAVVCEPLSEGENEKSYQKAATTEWKEYPYSVILVLGAGPDNYLQTLNPVAKISLRNAAAKFREGAAPFIMVSGGKVHPYKTPNIEAVHMKQYLMQRLGIPGINIIIEPHARHTTSNIRNAARIIYRNGIPSGKPMLVCSTEAHISTICRKSFEERCMREIKHIPYRQGKRVGKNFVEFFPLSSALQINDLDPLDP